MREKLKSSRGTSMILALLYVLISLSVGAVVLTAASSNSGRLQRDWTDQRDYLAVESAMDLLRKEVAGATFTGRYQSTEVITKHTVPPEEGGEPTIYFTYAYHYSEGVDPEGDPPTGLSGSQVLTNEAVDLMPGYLHAVAKPFKDGGAVEGKLREWKNVTPQPITRELELTVPGQEGFPTVQGSLNIRTVESPTYQILIDGQLYVPAGTAEAPVKRFPISFSWASKPASTVMTSNAVSGETVTTTTNTHTTTVTWNEPVIQKGAIS